MARRSRTEFECIADEDAANARYGDDPWQSVRRALNVVSLDAAGGDVEDPNSHPNNDTEAPEPDVSDAVRSLGDAVYEILTEEERSVILQRVLGDTHREIAAICELSGPGQALKIERRALRKLRERLSNFQKLFAKKGNRP